MGDAEELEMGRRPAWWAKVRARSETARPAPAEVTQAWDGLDQPGLFRPARLFWLFVGCCAFGILPILSVLLDLTHIGIQMTLVTSIPDTSIYWVEAYLRPSRILNKHILVTRIFLWFLLSHHTYAYN